MINRTATGMTGDASDFSSQTFGFAAEIWQWIAGNAVGILIASVIGTFIALALIGLRSLSCRMIRQGSDNLDWRAIFARVVSRTNLFFIVMVAAELVAEHANTPPALLRVIHILFVVASAFQAAIWARELILGFIEYRVGPEERHSTLASAIGIIRLLVSVALFAIALVLILDNLGVNVTGLVAGLGIGGIAIGLAAQGIFSDLFAALSIIFDKPFRKGDAVRFDDVDGNVEQIGLKTTRIRSSTGEQVVFSNAKLLEKQLRNFADLKRRRMTLALAIVQQTPPEVCARVPAMLREIVEAQSDAKLVRCGMTGLGPARLDFELTFEVQGTDFARAFAARNRICLEIQEAFSKAEILLA